MNYDTEIENEAYAFLSELEDDIKAAILDEIEDISEIDCSESGYGEIRDAFHEQVVDRAYSIEDAAYVIAECTEEETDTGLWEGREMHEAMQTCAAFSFGNDVWARVEEMYTELYEAFETSYIVVDDDGNRHDGCEDRDFSEEDDAEGYIANEVEPEDREGLEVIEGRGNVDELWQEYEAENTESTVATGGEEELQVLRQWVRLNMKAGEWGGYPLGSVYIDARCAPGYSMPDVKDFYDYDVVARHKVPSMVGKYGDAVKERIAELEGSTGAPVTLTVTLEGDTKDEITARLQHIGVRIGEGDTGSHDWKLTKRNEG